VDLVVLPETAYPLVLGGPEGGAHLGALRRIAARVGAPLLVGAFGGAPAGGRRFNSLYLVDEGGVRGRYDKRRLVPVIERNPLASSRVLARLGDTSSYDVGAPAPPLDAEGVRVGALICFESAFADVARAQRRGGAELLVNATNDAWLGVGFPGRAARAQHEAHAVLRAIETGAPVVRSANGGRSAWIDARGRVTRVAEGGGEGVAVWALTLAGPPARALGVHGAPGPACVLVALLLLGVDARRRRGGRGVREEAEGAVPDAG
jgi:apolipoprotein N-acyltransferase